MGMKISNRRVIVFSRKGGLGLGRGNRGFNWVLFVYGLFFKLGGGCVVF